MPDSLLPLVVHAESNFSVAVADSIGHDLSSVMQLQFKLGTLIDSISVH